MQSDFSVIVERDSEGCYVASVPSLRGYLTQGRSLDEVIERIREAIKLCVRDRSDDSENLDFVGIHKTTVRS